MRVHDHIIPAGATLLHVIRFTLRCTITADVAMRGLSVQHSLLPDCSLHTTLTELFASALAIDTSQISVSNRPRRIAAMLIVMIGFGKLLRMVPHMLAPIYDLPNDDLAHLEHFLINNLCTSFFAVERGTFF